MSWYDWGIIFTFCFGYLLIIFEQFIHINKTSIALLMAIACWTIQFANPLAPLSQSMVSFSHSVDNVCQVIFFLLGALTIVELINSHKGFRVLTGWIKIKSKRKTLWATMFLAFFMSSILDNLTTTIVMLSLMRKVVEDREDRLVFGSLIVLSANAGGAWTPIGDVTTTLLWIEERVTTLGVVKTLLLPSLACMVVPVMYFQSRISGEWKQPAVFITEKEPKGKTILALGVCALVFVPIFKLLTHLPPFMGMLFGLGLLWVVTDRLHAHHQGREHLRVPVVLTKVDMASTLFFLGVLLSINCIESAGILHKCASWLNETVHNPVIIATSIGLVSSIIDNVSLVAACIGMYGIDRFPVDSLFWQLTAYCAGTGGSILIIGSAAGVAFMGIEQVNFFWYLKNITLKALLGYFAGLFVYLAMGHFF